MSVVSCFPHRDMKYTSPKEMVMSKTGLRLLCLISFDIRKKRLWLKKLLIPESLSSSRKVCFQKLTTYTTIIVVLLSICSQFLFIYYLLGVRIYCSKIHSLKISVVLPLPLFSNGSHSGRLILASTGLNKDNLTLLF